MTWLKIFTHRTQVQLHAVDAILKLVIRDYAGIIMDALVKNYVCWITVP